MIYRIKVRLLEMQSNVWRRLDVKESITFEELHEYIQISFNWSNTYEHYFIVDRLDLFTLGDESSRFLVGSMDMAKPIPELVMRDEQKMRLVDVLNKEHTSLTYVYDSHEDWRHEILLEKVLNEEEVDEYPKCLMVTKGAPEEGKRAQYESGEKKLAAGEMKRINDRLAIFSGKNGGEEMPYNPWEELFELTIAYKKLQPWKWIHSTEMFIVEIPMTAEFAYCSVLGMNGKEFGLGVHVGNEGLAYKMAVREGHDTIQTVIEHERSLLLVFEDRNALKTEDLRWIKKLGLRFRGRKEWPIFRSMSPGEFPWHFSRKEAQVFCEILKQAIHVAKETNKDEGYLLDGYDGRWRARLFDGEWIDGVKEAVVEPEEEEPLRISEIALKRVQKYRQVKMRLEFASFFEEEALQERDGVRPFFPNVVLGVEDERGLVVYYQMFERKDYGKQLQEALVDLLDKLTYLPAEIYVDSERVALKLVALTSKIGLKLVVVDRLINVEEARREIGR